MTNEQLAMLLQGYVTRLDKIINGLVDDLDGVEVERETVVQFEINAENSREAGGFLFYSGCTASNITESQTGDPVMLQPLKEIKEEMEEAVGVLLGRDED